MELMLLHFCKITPKEYASFEVQQLLDLIDMQSHLKREMNCGGIIKLSGGRSRPPLIIERRSMETNYTALAEEHKGNHSASHMLKLFKEDEDKAMEAELFDRVPNLGDVRRVDIDRLVREHSKQYLRFREDGYQVCRYEM